MIIYEVNLEIKPSIYADYLAWLTLHMETMLTFPGFIRASLMEQEMDPTTLDCKKLTVVYTVSSRCDLQHYFDHYAAHMRQDGIDRFGDQFKAERRIFNLLK